jgi:putative transposase
VIVHQAYRFALDPTRRQQRALASHVGGARFAYNWGLDLVKRRLDERAAGQDVEVAWTLPDLRREWNGAKAAVAADRRAGFPPAPFESRPTATM